MQRADLKNNEVLSLIRQKSSNERTLTIEIIGLLEEVDRRSLHLGLGYGSLLEFCVKDLKYSDSAAYRRISAMRVAREVPQIKEAIESGSLNLVTVTQAQTFFNHEKKYSFKNYSKAEKIIVLQSLENKSKREAEKILVQRSPTLSKPEVVRAVSENQTRLTLQIEESLLKQLEQLKSKYSHINPNPSYAELIQMMANELLKEKKVTMKSEAVVKPTEIVKTENATTIGKCELIRAETCRAATPPVIKRSRFISSKIKRFIFSRDGGCCSYQVPRTQKRCDSRFQLEIDHIQAFSKGGTNQVENLRLVCRQHNQYLWKFKQKNQVGQFSNI
jgi:hypothetical protein